MLKKNKIGTLAILALILLITIGINVRNSDEGILFDEQVMEYIHSRTTPLGISIMKKVTYLGSVNFLIPLSVIILFKMARNGNISGIILLILSLAGSFGLNFIIKGIFIRTRPVEYFLIEQGGYSFPSGHSMVSMSFYTTMTYLLTKNQKQKKVKGGLWIASYIMVGAIGFSRMYLGVHWPTDVIVGYLLGYLFYYILIDIYSKRLPS